MCCFIKGLCQRPPPALFRFQRAARRMASQLKQTLHFTEHCKLGPWSQFAMFGTLDLRSGVPGSQFGQWRPGSARWLWRCPTSTNQSVRVTFMTTFATCPLAPAGRRCWTTTMRSDFWICGAAQKKQLLLDKLFGKRFGALTAPGAQLAQINP